MRGKKNLHRWKMSTSQKEKQQITTGLFLQIQKTVNSVRLFYANTALYRCAYGADINEPSDENCCLLTLSVSFTFPLYYRVPSLLTAELFPLMHLNTHTHIHTQSVQACHGPFFHFHSQTSGSASLNVFTSVHDYLTVNNVYQAFKCIFNVSPVRFLKITIV